MHKLISKLPLAKVYLICGNICTGKTYYAKQLSASKNAVLLSCDEIENDLFHKNLGEAHDEMAERIHFYLLKKAVEIISHGTNVILDWGFWQKKRPPQDIRILQIFRYRL